MENVHELFWKSTKQQQEKFIKTSQNANIWNDFFKKKIHEIIAFQYKNAFLPNNTIKGLC